MSFNVPNVFTAGRKAVAYDVNENFTAIKNEINSQKTTITNLSSSLTSLTNTVNGGMKSNLEALIRASKALFCANSGNKNSTGDADLLAIDSLSENNIAFKVSDGESGNFAKLVYTNATGSQIEKNELTNIDMNGKADGTYIIYGAKEGNPYALKNTVYVSKSEPSLQTNDVWFDVSTLPYSAKKYNGSTYTQFDDVPLGEAVISNGDLSSVKTYAYNQNGYDFNSLTEIKSSELLTSIFHKIIPDYSTKVAKATDTTHTADKDGYLSAKITLPDDSEATVTIDGHQFYFKTTAAWDIHTLLLPVAKGMEYSATSRVELYFISSLV